MPNQTKTETKDFKFTLADSDDDKGVFHGYASVWDVVDSYGDAVQKGAFKKTLKDKKIFPMLWSHSINDPIGTITGTEDEHGLFVEGVLNLDVPRAVWTRSLIKQGAINGLSIGYQTKREEIDKENGTRKLKEIALWEISPVVFPALEATEITDCKGVEFELKPYPNEHACRLREPGDFEDESFRRTTRKHEGKEYSVILGKLKGDTTMTEQAYRYSKETWTAAEAKAHCQDHDGSFEAATEKCKECGATLDEPAQATPVEEPHPDNSKPEEHLHLLMEFRDKALALKNLIEGVSR